MQHKKDISRVNEALTTYKGIVDGYADQMSSAEKTVDDFIKSNERNFTDSYKEEYRKKNVPSAESYRELLNTARNTAKAETDRALKHLKSQLDRYFNSEVRPDFATKISLFSTMGLDVNDTEFKLLADDAKGYLEKRMIANLAKSRTGEGTQVPDKYDVPNITSIYASYDSYDRSIRRFLNQYCGQNCELYEALEPDSLGNRPDRLVCMTADQFFRTNATESITNVLEGMLESLPDSRKLNTEELALLDIITESAQKYPSLAKEEIRNIASRSELAADLICRDERFAKYLVE